MQISSQMNPVLNSATHSSPHNDTKSFGAGRPGGMERYWGDPSSQPEEGTYGTATRDPSDPVNDDSHRVPLPQGAESRPAEHNAEGQPLDPFGNPINGGPGSYGSVRPPEHDQG